MFLFHGVCNSKLAGLLLHSVRINTGDSSLVLVTSVVNMLGMAVPGDKHCIIALILCQGL